MRDKSTYTLPIEKYVTVGTWTIRRQQPCLVYWRDNNFYGSDPYIFGSINPGEEINEAARSAVIESLQFEGIQKELAIKAIKKVQQYGTLINYFIEEESGRLINVRRKAPLVFVKVEPSILNIVGSHFLLRASVLQPYSNCNSSLEKRIEAAFKKFVIQK